MIFMNLLHKHETRRKKEEKELKVSSISEKQMTQAENVLHFLSEHTVKMNVHVYALSAVMMRFYGSDKEQ